MGSFPNVSTGCHDVGGIFSDYDKQKSVWIGEKRHDDQTTSIFDKCLLHIKVNKVNGVRLGQQLTTGYIRGLVLSHSYTQ